MTCQPAARSRVRKAERHLRDCASVVDAGALDPEQSLTGRWEVEIVVEPERGGVPAPVLEEVARQNLALKPGGPRGGFLQVVAVA